LFLELPIGYEAQVRPKRTSCKKWNYSAQFSGNYWCRLSWWNRVILVNLSNEPFVIENGERIAQLIIAKHERAQWIEVQELTETSRGEGFGSEISIQWSVRVISFENDK
jgi:dUTP pyrophosphatase